MKLCGSIGYNRKSLSKRTQNKDMKQLLALILAAGFAGCAKQSEPVAISGTHYPYSRYSTTAEVRGPTTVYASWTTDKLQKRRLELYAMVPQTQTRNGVPVYLYSGTPLPQQDEIKAIESELNKRYKAGDKSAELKEWWPSSRRHIS